MSGIDKLVEALTEAQAPREMIAKASIGTYSDPTKTTPFPIVELAEDCKNANLPEIVTRAAAGEFDVTLDEWKAFTGETDAPPDEPDESAPVF